MEARSRPIRLDPQGLELATRSGRRTGQKGRTFEIGRGRGHHHQRGGQTSMGGVAMVSRVQDPQGRGPFHGHRLRKTDSTGTPRVAGQGRRSTRSQPQSSRLDVRNAWTTGPRIALHLQRATAPKTPLVMGVQGHRVWNKGAGWRKGPLWNKRNFVQ